MSLTKRNNESPNTTKVLQMQLQQALELAKAQDFERGSKKKRARETTYHSP